jgi:hypothetical protein
MNGWRRNAEVGLHLGLRRGAPVNLGIVVNERQVLPLFLRVTLHRFSLLGSGLGASSIILRECFTVLLTKTIMVAPTYFI